MISKYKFSSIVNAIFFYFVRSDAQNVFQNSYNCSIDNHLTLFNIHEETNTFFSDLYEISYDDITSNYSDNVINRDYKSHEILFHHTDTIKKNNCNDQQRNLQKNEISDPIKNLSNEKSSQNSADHNEIPSKFSDILSYLYSTNNKHLNSNSVQTNPNLNSSAIEYNSSQDTSYLNETQTMTSNESQNFTSTDLYSTPENVDYRFCSTTCFLRDTHDYSDSVLIDLQTDIFMKKNFEFVNFQSQYSSTSNQDEDVNLNWKKQKFDNFFAIEVNNNTESKSTEFSMMNSLEIKDYQNKKTDSIIKNKETRELSQDGFLENIIKSRLTEMIQIEQNHSDSLNDGQSDTNKSGPNLFENEHFIMLLFDNMESNIQLVKKFVDFDTNFDALHSNDVFLQAISLKIADLRQQFNTEEKNSKIFKTSHVIRNFQLDGFCFFCSKNTCFYSPPNSSFRYEIETEKLYFKTTDFIIWNSLFSLFQNIEKIPEIFKLKNNLFLYFSHFNDLRKNLQKIMKIMKNYKLYKLRLNFDAKKKIMKNIYHDFKSRNLELKIILIPEFYSLLFLIIDLERNLRCCYKNIIFFSLYFYLRMLEIFCDFVLQNDDYFVVDPLTNEKKLDERKQAYISFFMRIIFIEPLIIIITKNKNILYKYQFHILSLVEIEHKYLKKQDFDNEMMIFLKIHIWWICHLNKNLLSKKFLDYYQHKDIYSFMSANINQFNRFTQLFNGLKALRSDILSDSLIDNKSMKHLKNFTVFCKEWCK